ncbi:SusC/RagA family TonB-linked outer membrane protein [Polaribacter sp. Hel1_85]|uniref:SusC/RagA family TonB-linked outer membrane protein n=1 Tax=Polaribacter sp. Hel1_85 TaxID=1250005 RepID=UPI00052DBA66|nr:SusC/RagA family TonB-linked outer membrane protein [Polaribacter sp. Hel1_85]KGL58778.1 TonB-dependent receptor, plug [Polaribacter sp. Hel1_85]
MKTCLLLFCTTLFSFTPKEVFSQNEKIKIETDQIVTVDEVFKMIKHQTNYTFIYKADLFENYSEISLKKGYIRAEKLLKKVLSHGNFISELSADKTISIKNKPSLIIEAAKDVKMQQQVVKGVVLDETGEPLPEVSVSVKGTKRGTFTDFDGNYKIQLSNANEKTVLIFSYLGFEEKEIVVGSKTTINVKMIPSQAKLDEVVVIGYGTTKVKDATGVISRLTAKEIETAPMGASVSSLLEGRAASVNVQINSASPTSNVNIIIRGASSLTGNNQPLWVIDGVPQALEVTSGDVANTLFNLNIDDVQSIDILKDASASAVYGSRAAGGVILVTTKRGKLNQKPTFEISTRASVSDPDFNGYEFFEKDDYINFTQAMHKQDTWARGSFDTRAEEWLDEQAFFDLNTSEWDMSDLVQNPDAYYDGENNWLKEFSQSPISVDHNFSVRGGSEQSTYFASFKYIDQIGVIKGGKTENYSGRFNFDTRINEDLKFELRVSGGVRDADNKDQLLESFRKIRPDIKAFNEDGSFYTEDQYTENPYITLSNTNHSKSLTLSVTGSLEYQIVDGLKLKTAFSNSYSDSESLRYYQQGSIRSDDQSLGERRFFNSKSSANVWDNTLAYSKVFGDKHDIQALLGYSAESRIRRSYLMEASNFPDDEILNNFGSEAEILNIDEDKTESGLVSQFARVQYKFDERYILAGTIRRDGSSRFGPNNRYGTFPSASAAWLVTGENFMQSEKVKKYISFLKLRASYGITGTPANGNFDWITLVDATTYNESPAILPDGLGNPNLGWEESALFDVGLDFGLLDDRLFGSVGYYEKESTNLIYREVLPGSSGYRTVSGNVASTLNSGIEFNLNYDIIRNVNHRLTFNLNWAKNETEILSINAADQELLIGGAQILKAGDIVGRWLGLQTAGRFFVNAEDAYSFTDNTTSSGQQTHYGSYTESTGDIIYIDQAGEDGVGGPDGVIDFDDDKVDLGTSVPKGYGGFGLTYTYKGFRVNTTFSYAYGHKRLWNLPRADIGGVGNYNQSNLVAGQSATLLSPYDADYPRLGDFGISNNDEISDLYLYNASYIRLNSLNIAYKLPNEIFNNSTINGVELTFQGTNLFTITKYPGFSPTGGYTATTTNGTNQVLASDGIDYGTYPSAQVYSVGVKVKL